MIAEILPSIKLPNTVKSEIFSYKIPLKLEDKIKVGQIVKIEFRNKKIQGIVMNISKDSTIDSKKLKEIIKILDPNITITKMQIDITNFITDNYFVNKTLALKTVIPEIPKR